MFQHHGKLIACARIRGSDETSLQTITRSLIVAEKICNWVQIYEEPGTLVTEWPQIYKATKSKGDPNDLIALAAIGSMVARACESWRSSENLALRSLCPTVKQWSGGIPKEIKGKLPKDAWSSPRGKRIASVLTAAERALIPNSHDAIDAVGIGLWALGRLVPVRVYPGT